MLFGIDVIIVAPGSVATPIWDKAEQIDLAPYQKSPYFGIIKRFRDYMIAEGRKGWSSEGALRRGHMRSLDHGASQDALFAGRGEITRTGRCRRCCRRAWSIESSPRLSVSALPRRCRLSPATRRLRRRASTDKSRSVVVSPRASRPRRIPQNRFSQTECNLITLTSLDRRG